tara:strand:+ start:27 stop:1355 length:1329 start_codon:yes stop_codon:yes gene_type:complete
MQINLFEDIRKNSISGEILLQDSAGYVSEGPIIGQEYFRLKIQTPSLVDERDIINFTENVFVINSVQSRGEAGNNISVYLLSFSSSEVAKNQRTKIDGSLTGTYSDIVKQMLDRVNCQKKIFLEPTRGVKRMVAPNLRPFDVIQMALQSASSAISDNFSPSYLFFESFEGYNFRSLASLYAQPVSQTYTTLVAGGQVKNGIVDIEAELANIIDYEIVDNSNTMYNHTTGVLGSKLIVHNIYSKSFKEYTYNYFDSFSDEKHITSYHDKNQFPIFSDVTIEKNGSRSSDFPARTYLSSISEGETDVNNTTEDGTEPFFAPDPQNTLQERSSTINQLEKGLILNISTHGNTSIHAGDIVRIDIPLVASVKTPENRKNDRFYQGVFLVKRIKHEFDFGVKKHGSILTLVKDSLPEKLEGPNDQYEPKPEKSPIIISDKEILYPQL